MMVDLEKAKSLLKSRCKPGGKSVYLLADGFSDGHFAIMYDALLISEAQVDSLRTKQGFLLWMQPKSQPDFSEMPEQTAISLVRRDWRELVPWTATALVYAPSYSTTRHKRDGDMRLFMHEDRIILLPRKQLAVFGADESYAAVFAAKDGGVEAVEIRQNGDPDGKTLGLIAVGRLEEDKNFGLEIRRKVEAEAAEV